MEDAAARKARLKAMRQEAAAAAEGGGDQAAAPPAEPPAEVPAEEPVLKFRNYAVRDEKIEHKKVWRAALARLVQLRARAGGGRRHALAVSGTRAAAAADCSPRRCRVRLLQVEAAQAPEFEDVVVDPDALTGGLDAQVRALGGWGGERGWGGSSGWRVAGTLPTDAPPPPCRRF